MKLVMKSDFEGFTTYCDFRMSVDNIEGKRVWVKVSSSEKQFYIDMHLSEFRFFIDSFFRNLEKKFDERDEELYGGKKWFMLLRYISKQKM